MTEPTTPTSDTAPIEPIDLISTPEAPPAAPHEAPTTPSSVVAPAHALAAARRGPVRHPVGYREPYKHTYEQAHATPGPEYRPQDQRPDRARPVAAALVRGVDGRLRNLAAPKAEVLTSEGAKPAWTKR